MDEKQLSEWKALAEAATDGPWMEREHKVLTTSEAMRDEFGTAGIIAHNVANADARFIAAARTAVPELVAEVERLKGLFNRAAAYKTESDAKQIGARDAIAAARRAERARCAALCRDMGIMAGSGADCAEEIEALPDET